MLFLHIMVSHGVLMVTQYELEEQKYSYDHRNSYVRSH